MEIPHSIDAVIDLMQEGGYIAPRPLATSLLLAMRLKRPLFLEGEPGVGKTEIAKVLARMLNRPLIRLQCYEGLDQASALYEWNYPRQMLEIRLAEAAGKTDKAQLASDIFTERFLIKRPLLQALQSNSEQPPILLIDELDRADEPFEAFLLELLEEYQVSIPEFGTIKATRPPIVILTSNRTREVHDALKRRCFYHWVDFPDRVQELAILRMKFPDMENALLADVIAFVQHLRGQDLFKSPGIAETLDWANALLAMGCPDLAPSIIEDTLGILLKYRDDLARFRHQEIQTLLAEAKAGKIRA